MQVDTLTTALQPGDGLLLCSDGLTRYVKDSELPRALPNYSALGIENLVGLARARGGADNITALVVSMMAPNQRINLSMPTKALRKFSFLEGCTLDEIRAFWNLMDMQTVTSGETIFSEGEDGDNFYLLAEGLVELHRADRCLATINPGEPFGEMALVAENMRTSTAIAIEDCRLLSIGRHRFFQLLCEQSPLASHLLLRMFENAVRIVRKQNIRIAEHHLA